MIIKDHEVIFFNGDSVTDCGRDRQDRYSLSGYVSMISDKIKKKYPDLVFEIFNRGISGNRSRDVLSRIDGELREIQPTMFVLLIGINDTWRRYDANSPTQAEEYAANVEQIILKVKNYTEKIVLMEPFLSGAGEDKIFFYEDLGPKLLRLRAIAKKYGLEYIALDGRFAEQAAICEVPLTKDGIHPTEAGQEFISDQFIERLHRG